MAALQTTQVTLPTDVSLAVVGKAHDTSTIATLSPADKLGFLDDKYNVFNGKARAEVVAEDAKKGGYEQPCCSILPAYLFLVGALENRRFRGPVALVV